MKYKTKWIIFFMALLCCAAMMAFVSACGGDNIIDEQGDTGISSTQPEQPSTIEKKTYDMSGVVFDDLTLEYDGQEHSIYATNLPVGVSVSYDGNGKVFAGTYTVIAHFIGDSLNYNNIPDKTATLSITKATYDMSGVIFSNLIVEYDEQEHSIVATNLPEGVTATYEGNSEINAGTYTITAHFTGNSLNYNSIPDKTAILTITRDTHKVTFKQEGQKEIIREVLDLAGLMDSDIPIPVKKTGYTVIWEETDLFRVTEDVTVNAVYIPKQFTIIYLDGGSNSFFSGQFETSYPTFHIYDKVTDLIEPTREGYVFTGWFKNIMCDGVELTNLEAQTYSEDIILYARWAATITFNTDGGSEILPITQNPNTPVFEPTDIPIKKSYVFVKWQLDGEDYVFDIMPSINLTLVAVWEFYENGTEFYPYVISNKDQLLDIDKLDIKDDSSYFELTNDIDMEAAIWSPIKNFYGIIDGNNYRIFNFTISTMPRTSYTYSQVSGHTYYNFEYETGLFCSTGSNSVIKNLGIDDCSISVTLALTGSVVDSYDLYAGGLVGRNNGVIENCFSTCEINISTGDNLSPHLYIGGLVGQNSGSINNSYNVGCVYGSSYSIYAGGSVGL